VAATNELLGKRIHDTLGATVAGGRDGLKRRCELSDSQVSWALTQFLPPGSPRWK
jgi:hypothetical protein